MNYITTNTVLEPGKTTEADLQNLSVNQLSQTTTYFDGLGRPLQTVATQVSPTKQDLVQATQYDAYGQQPKSYLPFTGGNNGHYHPHALVKDGTYTNSDQALFYQNSPGLAHDSQPYASAILESSPFSTVTEAGAPGQHWNPNGPGRRGPHRETQLPDPQLRGSTALDLGCRYEPGQQSRFLPGYELGPGGSSLSTGYLPL